MNQKGGKMENKQISSGAIVVSNPFGLRISGTINVGMLSASRALIICASRGIVEWIEVKEN